MATQPKHGQNRTELASHDFYLPGTSISSAFETAESVLTAVFGRHGRVLIPTTYNK